MRCWSSPWRAFLSVIRLRLVQLVATPPCVFSLRLFFIHVVFSQLLLLNPTTKSWHGTGRVGAWESLRRNGTLTGFSARSPVFALVDTLARNVSGTRWQNTLVNTLVDTLVAIPQKEYGIAYPTTHKNRWQVPMKVTPGESSHSPHVFPLQWSQNSRIPSWKRNLKPIAQTRDVAIDMTSN